MPDPDARRLEERVLRFVRRTGACRPGEGVLVAVSGGPDSSALLLILSALARRLRVELRAAYFDHGLRGAAAVREERAAVEQLATATGVPLTAGAGDVRALAHRQRLSLEDAARRCRYAFLADAAARQECVVVAGGHTLDDQAETVLLHLVRGSGLAGLAGMAPRSRWPFGGGPDLARPLLAVRRSDTEDYCRRRGVTPVEDLSNRSSTFRRNRLRNEVMPALRALNPRIEDALARLAEAVRGDLDLLEAQAAAALPPVAGAGSLAIPRRAFRDLPPALRLHAARLALQRLLPEGAGLRRSHLQALADAGGLPAGAVLQLPAGIRLEAGYRDLRLSRGDEAPPPFPAEPVPLAVPGCTEVGGWRFEAEVRDDLPPPSPALLVLDGEMGPLAVRRRRPGDRFQPAGMAVEKKLQDVLVDARVPRRERDALPLLVCARGIAAVPGVRAAEWARARPDSRSVLVVRLART